MIPYHNSLPLNSVSGSLASAGMLASSGSAGRAGGTGLLHFLPIYAIGSRGYVVSSALGARV